MMFPGRFLELEAKRTSVLLLGRRPIRVRCGTSKRVKTYIPLVAAILVPKLLRQI